MAFSTLIIGVAFLPLFTMTGVSGVIFSPMAHTYAFAIGGAIILALTLTPVLAKRILRTDLEEKENVLMRVLHRLYNPLFDAALRRPKRAMLVRLVPIFLCVVLFPFLGREFMPKLEEGNFWIRATLPTSISLQQSSQYVGRMRANVRSHPEVLTVVSQLGRPDDGTDVSGFFNIELFAPLKEAMGRLVIIIPITLLLIGFLTYSAVKNWVDTLIVIVDIPVACTGGVLALLLTRQNFSVSAAMGFISIFGIAIQDAILVVTYFQRLRYQLGRSIVEAAREAAEKRFRPVLMTTLVATIGLLPAAVSNGIGAQTQKPLAIVVIGGSLILAILTRVLQPPLLVMAHEWLDRRRARRQGENR